MNEWTPLTWRAFADEANEGRGGRRYASTPARFGIEKHGKQFVLFDAAQSSPRQASYKTLAEAKRHASYTWREDTTERLGVFLQACAPGAGPHQHDAKGGVVYRLRFLEFVEGKPVIRSIAPHAKVEAAGHGAVWSWGLGGFVTDGALDAERFTRSLYGETFLGWIS